MHIIADLFLAVQSPVSCSFIYFLLARVVASDTLEQFGMIF